MSWSESCVHYFPMISSMLYTVHVYSCLMVPAGSKLTWSCPFTNLLYSGWATSQTQFCLFTQVAGCYVATLVTQLYTSNPMLPVNCVRRVTSSLSGYYTSIASHLATKDVLISWSVEPPTGKEQMGGSCYHLSHVSCW